MNAFGASDAGLKAVNVMLAANTALGEANGL